MEALVVSSCPMATFISLCSWSTSSDRVSGSALGWFSECGVEGMLATVGVCNAGGRRWWVTDWDKDEDAIGHGHTLLHMPVRKWSLAQAWLSLLPLGWVGLLLWWRCGAPKATQGGFLPWGCCAGRQALRLWGRSAAAILKPSEYGGQGFWWYEARVWWQKRGVVHRVVLIALGFVLHRSTSIMEGFWTASPVVAAFQSGSSLKLNTKASSPTFNPSWAHYPLPTVVVAFILVTGGEGHKGSFGVHLSSRHQGVPHWIVVHATWCHSSKERHMASLGLHWAVKPGIGPPPPGTPGMFGKDVPTWPLDQRSSCTPDG